MVHALKLVHLSFVPLSNGANAENIRFANGEEEAEEKNVEKEKKNRRSQTQQQSNKEQNENNSTSHTTLSWFRLSFTFHFFFLLPSFFSLLFHL